MARVMPILTNEEAIAVNRQWAGHPGQLKVAFSEAAPRLKLNAVPCDGSQAQAGWSAEKVTGGIVIRSTRYPGLCVDASEPGGQGNLGLGLRNCSSDEDILGCQRFVHDGSGNIHASDCLSNEGRLDGCFDVSGKTGPDMQLTRCYENSNDHFTFEADGVWHSQANGSIYPERCVEVQSLPSQVSFQVWNKPQPAGGLAVFFLNALERKMTSFVVDLEKDLDVSSIAIKKGFKVRDIWNHKDLPSLPTGSKKLVVEDVLARDSVFLLLTPHGHG